jgi:hypoxanthine phosphoribosyltransferase
MAQSKQSHNRVELKDKVFEIIISEDTISQRLDQIGDALSARFSELNPLFIPVLNGAFIFSADLVRRFRGHCETTFVKLESYKGLASTGSVITVMGLQQSVTGRHVILVEDIIDTGRTLHFFMDIVRQQNPESLSVATFLRKPEAEIFPVPVNFLGFDIPNRFVVGYGLDYDGLGRNLPGVYGLLD